MAVMQIKHRLSGAVLFEGEAQTTRELVALARKAGANLSGANLSGANLSGANLYGANLYGADLSDADLRYTNLSGTNLYGTNLSGANLRYANLYGADLYGADLSDADLRYTNLSGADLRGADLRGAQIGANILTALKGRAGRSDGYEFLIFATEQGHIIRAGCRTMTLEQFRAHVAESYPDTPKAAETLRILNFLEASLTQEQWS